MRFKNAMKFIFDESGMSQTSVSRQIGKVRSHVSTVLYNENPKLDTLREIAEVLGFRIVLESKHGKKFDITKEFE